jgi:non-specific serine/threonine protein kinase
MLVITPDVISAFNIYAVCDYKTVQRAQSLVNMGRVKVLNYSLDQATCRVNEKEDSFTVQISLVGKKQFSFSCTCSEFTPSAFCRHVPASLLALSHYLYSQGAGSWQYRLANVLQTMPRKAATSKRQKYGVIFGLQRSSGYSSDHFNLVAYTLRDSPWGNPGDYENNLAEFYQKLGKDISWQRFATNPYQALSPEGCINLPAEGVAIVNLILQSDRFFYGGTNFSTYLPLLGKMDAPVYLMENQKFERRLTILNEPVEIQAALGKAGDKYVLQAGLEVNGKIFSSIKESIHLLSTNPPWAIAGEYITPIRNPHNLPLFSLLPLEIPAAQEEDFRKHFLREIAERVPLKGDALAWEDVSGDAVPRLYLVDNENTLRANLVFAYGEYEVQASPTPEAETVIDIPGAWGMVRVHRDQARELEYYQLLTDPVYRLKRASVREQPPGTFDLRGKAHPFDFLIHSIPLLTKAGFEIYGEEKLKAGKINRNPPKISLYISSGLDWFDLQATVAYGDQEVSLRDVYRALRKNEGFIKLADGSIGQIPEDWLDRYRRIFALAEETEDGLRVSEFHLPLVDTLLADAQQAQVVPEFHQRRERLRSFDRIQPRPMPAGFQGELRPYQKAGYDWLHFLREYHLGGCLADDMGLGKTIQVLALLQSIREEQRQRGKNGISPACLLVVPKSLLANWQREGARFAPELSFLEYIGNTRVKDTAKFDNYDIVLTTYGTMLRDIELLRGYRFSYAILDESQAIKNPLAQSSKAARLLNAENRLVMTGTPVENSTYELWSQFAFLNPGLLGGLDFFKHSFAGPIETDHSEDSASMLRQLVYPFILRRTKAQVAPELPPRSERVMYTDMEPAQRKLYNQTRDRYRGIILGMVESEGIDNVRMKILEGLLRLRQISIHPGLVEPAYRGESPKFDLLFELMETLASEGHKALIFSQFVETLHMVRRKLEEEEIPFAYLDGQTRDRQGQVDIFQNDPAVRFFLISLKAGGIGLNLTAAEYVIHLDPWWNPAVEMQASDRAHRIGQENPVFIYKIIARDTVEEKILLLQEKKRMLVEQLISTEESFFKSLSASDVKVLFS